MGIGAGPREDVTHHHCEALWSDLISIMDIIKQNGTDSFSWGLHCVVVFDGPTDVNACLFDLRHFRVSLDVRLERDCCESAVHVD